MIDANWHLKFVGKTILGDTDIVQETIHSDIC